MKTSISTITAMTGALLLAAMAGCSSTGSTPSAPVAASDGRITVAFENPKDFTDVKSSSMSDVEESYLKEIRTFIDREARLYLAEGQTFEITFTDLDMAGEFEPWRMRASDVRFVKSIYPPRAKFTWAVRSADGSVVKQGTEKLCDLGFGSTIRTSTIDELYYEKEMLRDWMRSALR